MNRSESIASEVQVVLVTAPDGQVAAELARDLVEKRLAACVNIVGGVRSIYRWQGVVEDDSETLLLIKTRSDRCEALARRVNELHPADLPEVLALPVVGGSLEYLRWVTTEAAG